jgi:peptidoglycan hydrolase-like protein with peptidoglycan-binding domain
MKRLILILLLAPALAMASGPFTSINPERFVPVDEERTAPSQYADFISAVQERLNVLGFDAGPANGDFGAKMQAALAQFQLSLAIPASGQLDDETLSALGIQRPEQASEPSGTDLAPVSG